VPRLSEAADSGGAADRSATGEATRLPVRSVLADGVYQILKESLLSHRVEPGSRLNVDQLAGGSNTTTAS
jgi:DNA-binding GntR family transcriptional regulator